MMDCPLYFVLDLSGIDNYNQENNPPILQYRITTMIKLSDQNIADFKREGAIHLHGLFQSHWLESLAIGVAKNFADPGPYSTVYTQPGQPGGFYDDYCNWQRIHEYQEFIEKSPAAEIAGKLMGSTTARIYHEHVLIKEPGTREATPWHHDMPYYGVDGDHAVSIWLPLDPVPRAVCPEFVAGTHDSGKLYYPRLFRTSENYGDNIPGFETIPEIDANRDQLKILSWDLQPGDCIVFHMRTIHGAPPTTNLKSRRRGFSTRWIGDDVRFAVRPWKTSPPFPEVELSHGDCMNHPSFPQLWAA